MSKTLAPSTSVTARDPKGLKFISIVEAAYNKADLSDGEAQRVNDTAGLSEIVSGFIAENRSTNKFKNEEVESRYGYLSGYKQPKSLNEQCNQLRILFPDGLGFPNQILLTKIEQGEIELPKQAEGWFAIPNWIKSPKIFGTTYSEAVQKVLDKIKKTRKGKFVNWREGQIKEQQLRQSAQTRKFFKDLSEAQGNPDILIVAAQFGLRHAGRSVRRGREVFLINEFGLGTFAVGIMILTHPERLQHCDDLWIDCAGDEFDVPGFGVRFGRAPCFSFCDDRVGFGAGDVSRADGCYGSVSGFAPQ